MSNSNHNDDNELQAFLEGRDQVSETYRNLPGDEPPQALDELILASARESVGEKKPAGRSMFSSKYSIAASLFTFFIIGSLYFTQDAMRDQPATISKQGPATAELDSSSIFIPSEISDDTSEAQFANDQIATVNEMSDQIDEARLVQAEAQRENEQNFRAAPPTSEELIITGSRVRTADLSPALNRAAREQADDAGLQSPQSMADADVSVPANTVTIEADTTAYDGVVTGQAFRQEPESWAEEIYYLRQEANNANSLLIEEIRLFRQRFPEADLDDLLEDYENYGVEAEQ